MFSALQISPDEQSIITVYGGVSDLMFLDHSVVKSTLNIICNLIVEMHSFQLCSLLPILILKHRNHLRVRTSSKLSVLIMLPTSPQVFIYLPGLSLPSVC